MPLRPPTIRLLVWVCRATQDEALALQFASKEIVYGLTEAFDGGQVMAKDIRDTARPGRYIPLRQKDS